MKKHPQSSICETVNSLECLECGTGDGDAVARGWGVECWVAFRRQSLAMLCTRVGLIDFWFVVTISFWYSNLSTYKAGLLISNACPIACLCTLLFSQLLVLNSYLGRWGGDFLPLLYVCLYQWAFPFIIVLFLVVAFSFTYRKVALIFVIQLVWWCWMLLACAYLENFWFPYRVCPSLWVKYSWL